MYNIRTNLHYKSTISKAYSQKQKCIKTIQDNNDISQITHLIVYFLEEPPIVLLPNKSLTTNAAIQY